jgi:Cu/Ag efflux pump CusA
MLSTLIRFSIRYYGIVIALAILILHYGSYRFTTAGLDIFPEFAPKRVIIQSEAPDRVSALSCLSVLFRENKAS